MKMPFSFSLSSLPLSRNWLTLAGALAMGGVAVFLSNKLLHDYKARIDAQARAAHAMVKVVVAKRDLTRGSPIATDNFSLREMPAEYVHASALRPGQFDQYAGQRLAVGLKRGEALLDAHLESTNMVFSATLPKGHVGLTTEVDEVNSISGMLRPNDHIDLILTARPSNGHGTDTTFPLMSNVEVLATGQVTRKRDGANQPRTYTTITLALSPEDADRVVVAKGSGKLTAVLRNPDDTRPNSTAAMGIDQLLPKTKGQSAHRVVQYIVGGSGGSRS
jgi:pilus assembly protein CpaB